MILKPKVKAGQGSLGVAKVDYNALRELRLKALREEIMALREAIEREEDEEEDLESREEDEEKDLNKEAAKVEIETEHAHAMKSDVVAVVYAHATKSDAVAVVNAVETAGERPTTMKKTVVNAVEAASELEAMKMLVSRIEGRREGISFRVVKKMKGGEEVSDYIKRVLVVVNQLKREWRIPFDTRVWKECNLVVRRMKATVEKKSRKMAGTRHRRKRKRPSKDDDEDDDDDDGGDDDDDNDEDVKSEGLTQFEFKGGFC